MAKMTAEILVVVVISLFYSAWAATDGVPVLMWSNRELHKLPEALVGHTTSSDVFHQNYLRKLLESKEAKNLVVFLQDKLSIDDITQHADVYNTESDGAAFNNLKDLMDSHSSTHLPSVTAPSEAINRLQRDFSGKVHTLQEPYSLDSLPVDGSDSNLVVVKLPKTAARDEGLHKSLKHIDDIIGSVTSQLETKKVPYTAVYTAERSSKKAQKESLYTGRHLLQAEETSENYTFINLTDSTADNHTCFMFYARHIFACFLPTDARDKDQPCKDTIRLPPKTDATNSKCDEKYGAANFTLDYGNVDGTDVSFYLSFKLDKKAWMWEMNQFNVTFKASHTSAEKRTAQLESYFVSAPHQWSYHCTDGGPFYEKNLPKDQYTTYVKFSGFQTQLGGFIGAEFGRVNDCVGFFTIGTLMGLTVTLILTLILGFGLLMITNISTMDRFDDPKGKPVPITTID